MNKQISCLMLFFVFVIPMVASQKQQVITFNPEQFAVMAKKSAKTISQLLINCDNDKLFMRMFKKRCTFAQTFYKDNDLKKIAVLTSKEMQEHKRCSKYPESITSSRVEIFEKVRPLLEGKDVFKSLETLKIIEEFLLLLAAQNAISKEEQEIVKKIKILSQKIMATIKDEFYRDIIHRCNSSTCNIEGTDFSSIKNLYPRVTKIYLDSLKK